MTEQRRLAAILVADVVGFSKLVGGDEAGTLAQLEALRREIIEPHIAKHAGRLFKSVGDGFLIEFASAVQAVSCAKAIQEANSQGHLPLRIGIHVGDVVVQGDDLMGDGVNVAARVEGIAEPGGIAMTRAVHEQVRDKLDFGFADKGEIELKNIQRPVQVFVTEGAKVDSQATALPMPDKPSIAVLPFQNMSGDPEQEYFADGMVEEIIAALSRVHWLFVIARNSTFTYKGRAVDIKQVGRDLGVRYVLEGSVRKAGERIRINGQLIDAANGTHLWADRFDGALEDVFDLQDRVTASVVGAIAPKLEFAEIERAKRKPTGSLTAYDFYLRGLANMHQDNTREATDKALLMLSHAMEIDHDFASALGLAARCYARRKANGWMVDRALERAEGERLARRASVLARDDAVALCSAGFALAMLAGETEDGAELIDRALAIDPNMARGWHYSGLVRLWLGQPEVALEHNSRAIRLSPLDPLIGQMLTSVGHVHFFEGRYEEASQWTGRAMRSRPNWLPSMILATASAALSGRSGDAQQLASRLRSLDPTLRISNLRERLPFSRPEYLAPYEEGLRKAGLPE
jgi:TolB-like protein/tetratricopeptide (TPR) repeat protein